MKILHLIYDHINNPWVGGGGAVRAYEIYKRLSSCHEITVMSGKYPGTANYKEGNLSYRFVGTAMNNYVLSTFAYALKAAGFVRKHGSEFDVVVEDFAPWNPVFAQFLTKKPVILHVNHIEGRNIIKRWLLAGLPFFFIDVLYPRAYRLITVLSEETKIRVGRQDAAIVPPGIDGGLLDRESAATQQGDGGVLYIGRLHIKNKGLDTLMDAMSHIDAGLRLIGRGEDEGRLRELASTLRLKNVAFLGFLSEAEKIRDLRNATLLVLPSRFEGWGIVVLEAAACGRPVIVSDIPELKYAVDAGFGLSFRTGDAQDLAEKIRSLLENPSMRKEMGLKAREYARNFTWDRISEEYEEYLTGIVREAREDKT